MLSRRRIRFWFTVAIVAAIALLPEAGMAAPVDGTACNIFASVIEPGPTDLRAHGSTPFQNATGAAEDFGSGILTWEVHAQITGANTTFEDGQLFGYLTATIDWDDSKPTTTFASECVRVVWTSVGFLNEATFDGEAEEFPGLTGPSEGPEDATATLRLARVAPRRADLDFEMSLGDVCIAHDTFTIERDNAVARGSKTGNGGRESSCS